MTVCRRHFLQGSLSAGALVFAAPSGLIAGEAAPAGLPARSSVADGRRFLLLRSAGDDAFALPAMQVARRYGAYPVASLALSEKLAGAPSALQAILSQHRGMRLIGIMDDCTHSLLEETLRDLGGSILCRGRHRGLLNGATASRHSFTTTAATHGIGSAMASAMTANGTAFLVQEHSHCEDALAPRGGLSLPAAPWPAVLGTSYALMVTGLWTVGPAIAEHRRGAVADHPRSDAFVSLVAEI